MVPLDVDARHSRRFGGFRLAQPYLPTPVEQVSALAASHRRADIDLGSRIFEGLDERLRIGPEGLDKVVYGGTVLRVSIGPRHPEGAAFRFYHESSHRSRDHISLDAITPDLVGQPILAAAGFQPASAPIAELPRESKLCPGRFTPRDQRCIFGIEPGGLPIDESCSFCSVRHAGRVADRRG